MWECTVPDDYITLICHRANSEWCWKTTNIVKSGWTQLSTAVDVEWTIHSNVCQHIVNDGWSCMYAHSPVAWSFLCITEVLATSISKTDSNTVTAPVSSWASMERQWFLALQLGSVMFWLVADLHFWDIGSLQWQKQQRQARCAILKISIKWASTVLGLVYFEIKASGYLPVQNWITDLRARQNIAFVERQTQISN